MERNQNLTTWINVRMGPQTGRVVVIGVITMLAIFYTDQITKTGVLAYRLNALSQQRNSLYYQNQDLEVQAARLSSVNTIRGETNLTPTTKASFAP